MASSKTVVNKKQPKLAVAFSGGLDSAVLLHATVAAHGPEKVWAFHIHHGIQKQADAWQKHCATISKKLGCHFDTLNVKLAKDSNIEAQARELRYQALYDLCAKHGIEDILLAHHQDDQAETVLIQLMRGAGLAGLSGMPVLKNKMANAHSIHIWRPFLDLPRKKLEAYAFEHGLKWIEDPSNQDESYRRNAIRKSVLPQLEKVQIGAVENLARSAKHMAEANELLVQLADIDLGLIEFDKGLSKTNLIRLYKTSQARAKNVLRRWIHKHQLNYPSEDRMAAWWKELQEVRVDAKLQWEHDGALIRLWRGYLSIEIQSFKKTTAEISKSIQDASEALGEWIFKTLPKNSKKIGIDRVRFEDALKNGLVNTMPRVGGEKFKSDAKRPRRSLKNLYQEANIPPWQRDLPLLYIGEELIAVPGIGISADWQTTVGPRISPEWASNV